MSQEVVATFLEEEDEDEEEEDEEADGEEDQEEWAEEEHETSICDHDMNMRMLDIFWGACERDSDWDEITVRRRACRLAG